MHLMQNSLGGSDAGGAMSHTADPAGAHRHLVRAPSAEAGRSSDSGDKERN
jgi:hypothetical protein